MNTIYVILMFNIKCCCECTFILINLHSCILINNHIFQQIPQVAQIITPNGQIQQVQIANLPQLQSLQVSIESIYFLS